MRVYIGQARNTKMIRRLWAAGFGECTQRGELPPRRHPWFFDNGAFRDWRRKKPFDSARYLQDVEAIYRTIDRPEWILLPDIVAGGLASLEASRSWMPYVRGLAPLYLAVQDGMEPADVAPLLPELGGIFVGGTVRWKVRTGAMWNDFAHAHQKRCHVGRVGTIRRVRWAQRIQVDSIDSSFPLWTHERLERFIAAMEPSNDRQLPLLEAA